MSTATLTFVDKDPQLSIGDVIKGQITDSYGLTVTSKRGLIVRSIEASYDLIHVPDMNGDIIDCPRNPPFRFTMEIEVDTL